MSSSSRMATILEELAEHILLGDGATGTYLQSLGVAPDSCLEEACLNQPDLVTRVYEDYAVAGSRVIETNSFGANRLRLARFGLEDKVQEINEQSARLLVKVARPRGIYVGGSIGPIQERATDPRLTASDRQTMYGEQINALLNGGCDLIFLETFADLGDLLLALEVAQKITSLPIVSSLAISEEGRLGSSETFPEAFRRLRAAGAQIVGINGTCGVQASLNLLDQLDLDPSDIPAVYPNAGKPEFYEGRFNYAASPAYLAENVAGFVERGARLLGGDYGTEPRHIHAMAEAARNLRPLLGKSRVQRVATRVNATVAGASQRPSFIQEESLLDKVRQRRVTVVELDSPKTLSLKKFSEGAKALESAGADAITLADNSLAILRVSNFAAAVVLRQELKIPSLIHLACRDRNLLGMQSELLGLGTLGFRHVLALTGDPAKVGDHPGSTSVYDLTSVSLIKLMAGMNQGISANGKSLNGQTNFLIGCAFNPNALNFDSQVKKLESKIAAGAQYVLTQPVFDRTLIKKTADRLKTLGIPAFIGVMPILNSRNAEFLHNEVPGIRIPDDVRERFRQVPESQAPEIGLEFARQLREEVFTHSNALYLITPFLRYEVSVALMQDR